MGDNEIRQQIVHAADEFPVRGRYLDVQRRVVRRRRLTMGLATTVGVVVVAGFIAGVLAVTGRSPAPPGAGVSAFASATSADYIGSRWRLTDVTHGTTSTTITTDIGAQMDLFASGQLLASDGVHAISAKFTKSADGFEVRDPVSTATGYDGNDPRLLAAIGAFRALAYGDVATSTTACAGCHPSPGPAKNTVVTVDANRLVVQAGSFRLSFERTGPAVTNQPLFPGASGKPS